VSTHTDELGVALTRFMGLLLTARAAKFNHDQPAIAAIRECATLVAGLLPESLANAEVRWSVGHGNWAAVPWIAVLHPQITDTTQHGIYPVLLFDESLYAVELALAQGVTNLKTALGRRDAVRVMAERATVVRPDLGGLRPLGFAADTDVDLGGSPLGRDYAASVIVHRRYAVGELPTSTISREVAALLEAYGDLLTAGVLNQWDDTTTDPDSDADSSSRHAVMVYVNRDANENFEFGGQDGWWGWKEPPSGLEALRPDDLIVFGRGFDNGSPRVSNAVWQRGHLGEVVVGRITQPPERTDQRIMPDEFTGAASYPWKVRFEHVGAEEQVSLLPAVRLSAEAVEGLRLSATTRGAGILVPVRGSSLLEEFADDNPQPTAATPAEVAFAASQFLADVEESGLRFASTDVTAFLAAALTKPFTILTGQSGSGKTQLAERLGDWFGSDQTGRPRCLLVPVRPDWTGPEYLFGYQDVLRSSPGKRVWAVPDALEFMMQARAEPHAPFLLLLDEMNLAHVERYFADFLSGLESRKDILPELTFRDGEWIATGNSQRLPFPRNLLVIGTVNVDETTYLFSPKVLDRAFTFEFRTALDDLDPAARRPTSIAPAEPGLLDGLLGVALDDDWQHDHPHPEVALLANDLRELHTLLRTSGHEFGHRVMYEAIRYAAILGAAGVAERYAVLDRIVLTKLLPKIHGTRSRVEDTLRALQTFALTELEPGGAARLPRTAEKLARMLKVLVKAQFVSFTE
jgi:hypothetical protein